MADAIFMQPVDRPINGTIRPPGSKSITNRALILAALAKGPSKLTGVLDSVDTQVMLSSLEQLGFQLTHDSAAAECQILGNSGRIPADKADLFLQNSGTSIRFLTALCCLGQGRYTLDGIARMRERPIGDLVDSLNQLQASVTAQDNRFPPVTVDGTTGRISGGDIRMKANVSSQFLSAVLMAAGAIGDSVTITIDGELVSRPYITMTVQMMQDFGLQISCADDLSSFQIPGTGYTGTAYEIEPDASAASYFFGAAAVTGGTVTVSGLNRQAMQGDVRFVDALAKMGCQVTDSANSITVTGGSLRGIDIDMNAISDTAQTLAAVAVFADGPTTIRGVEHMRHKETDRISAVVTELCRAGIDAEEFSDGLRINPGQPCSASIQTYDDHRMAMSFALLGLSASGIRILDPGCTSKTYPNFFEDLVRLSDVKLQHHDD